MTCVSTFFTLPIAAQFEEGKMTVQLEVVELPSEQKGMEAMFNNTFTIYLDHHKRRVEMTLPELGLMIMITDSVKQETIVCMEMMDQKIAMLQPRNQSGQYGIAEKDFTNGNFELKSGTKTIAGHLCKRAIWTSDDKKDTIEYEIWYAADVDNREANHGALPGMAMEFMFESQGIKLKYTVIQLSKEAIDDSLFNLPAGYVLKTAAELGFPDGKN